MTLNRACLVSTTISMSATLFFAITLVRAGQEAPSARGQQLSTLNQASQSTLEELYGQIDRAIVKRDRNALEPLLEQSFTFIHANGALDSGPIFLSRVATGTAMMRQQHEDYKEFDPAWTNYGDRMAGRRSRVRIRTNQKNEYWMLQTRVLSNPIDGEWRRLKALAFTMDRLSTQRHTAVLPEAISQNRVCRSCSLGTAGVFLRGGQTQALRRKSSPLTRQSLRTPTDD
jgi:hypothetical protein